MSFKMIIGADFVPTESNQILFEQGNAEELIGSELLNILRSADYRVFNLEVPLTDMAAPIQKCGPNLIASTKSIVGYKALGVDFLTLANNHIMDQGIQGLHSTEKILSEQGICFAGVGETPEEAFKPFILQRDGRKIGIYCCAEHEFSIVSEDCPGANPFDPLESLDHIAALKQETDYVIVLYHGGKEEYRYPSPNLQKTCRKIVDKGADLVICQHTHCIGCKENGGGRGTIIYGQGNFLFDLSESEFWETGVLIEVVFDSENASINYIPIVKNGRGVRLADHKHQEDILRNFFDRSEQIKAEGFIQKNYDKFSQEMVWIYLRDARGKGVRNLLFRIINKLFRIINKLSSHRFLNWYLKKVYKQSDLTVIQGIIQCEAHRELFIHGVKLCIKSCPNQ